MQTYRRDHKARIQTGQHAVSKHKALERTIFTGTIVLEQSIVKTKRQKVKSSLQATNLHLNSKCRLRNKTIPNRAQMPQIKHS